MAMGRLCKETSQLLFQLLGTFVSEWQRAEQEKQQKKEEEESLFKFKTITHGDELTEEQRDELEIQQQFPSFDQVQNQGVFFLARDCTFTNIDIQYTILFFL